MKSDGLLRNKQVRVINIIKIQFYGLEIDELMVAVIGV